MKTQRCDEEERLRIIIGTGPSSESIFTDQSALAAISPVFRTMLQTPLSEQRTKVIKIEDADVRSFEVLLDLCGVVKTPGARINSVETAVGLLCLGQRYLIREVEEPALLYLQQHVDLHTALYVLQHLHVLYSSDFSGINFFIIQDCYSVIDSNARAILEMDEFEEISLNVVRQIIIRDSLGLRDETVVCKAIHRWSRRQCRRSELELSDENIRLMLNGTQYLVRYLTMSLRDFAHCQRTSKLLSEDEAKSVVFCMLYKNASLSPQFDEFQTVMARKRKRLSKFPLIRKSNNAINYRIPKTCMREIFIFFSCVFD